MRSSYIVPIHKGIVTLPRDLQEQMNIGKDCILYAKVADGSGVVSSIPPTSWTRAYRLIIHTAESPGTLAKVAGTVSKEGINFLASWSAAISPFGEGCLTSIVELPESLAGKESQEIQQLIVQRLRELEEAEPKTKVLSDSSLFRGEGPLDPVHLTSLGFLSAAVSRSAHEVYELNVRDWAIDLRCKTGSGRFSLYDVLKRFSHGTRPQLPTRALVTPDTEERYFRISFLPSETSLYFVELTLKIESPEGNFGGFFQTALEVLASHQLNIYSARNLLLEKSMKNGLTSQEETAKFSFVVDINGGSLEAIDPEGFQRVLQRDFLIALKTHAETLQADVKIQNESFTYTLYESSWPRCFLATNAKKNPRYLEFACKLHRELVALGLNPVNVDITMSESGVVLEDVTLLLRSCPLLISLHLPDERNELELDNLEEGDGKRRKARYAPSDWVLFEESYMRGLGRRVFRMRHETVREPAFSPGSREYVFKNSTFSRHLRDIADAVRRHMSTSPWLKDLEASAAAARDLDPALLQRNLEDEYCARRRAAGPAEESEARHE